MNTKQLTIAVVEMQQTIATQAATIAILEETLITMQQSPSPQARTKGHGTRDYGPASTRKMVAFDAWRIKFGDLQGKTANEMITSLPGLSRGQVYSAKGNYTFREVGIDDYNMDDVFATTHGLPHLV